MIARGGRAPAEARDDRPGRGGEQGEEREDADGGPGRDHDRSARRPRPRAAWSSPRRRAGGGARWSARRTPRVLGSATAPGPCWIISPPLQVGMPSSPAPSPAARTAPASPLSGRAFGAVLGATAAAATAGARPRRRLRHRADRQVALRPPGPQPDALRLGRRHVPGPAVLHARPDRTGRRVRGPVGPHQVSDVPVHSPDWTATLLELGGARPDSAYPLDGTSLAGYLLRGERVPERDLFWRVRGERALRLEGGPGDGGARPAQEPAHGLGADRRRVAAVSGGRVRGQLTARSDRRPRRPPRARWRPGPRGAAG